MYDNEIGFSLPTKKNKYEICNKKFRVHKYYLKYDKSMNSVIVDMIFIILLLKDINMFKFKVIQNS